jgi:uncharacterized membrane protein YtjA (UPF0391 family)
METAVEPRSRCWTHNEADAAVRDGKAEGVTVLAHDGRLQAAQQGHEASRRRTVFPSPTIHWRYKMLYWAVIFLVVALIAGVLGFSGIAGVATNIAWILFIVGLVLAVIFFISGRRPVP